MAHDFLDQLESEHDEVKDLLERIFDTEPSEVEEREDLFNEFKMALMPHMQGEERFFYSDLLNFDESRQAVLEAKEEHHGVKVFINEMETMDKASEEWIAKLTVVRDMLEDHISEEEDDIFNYADDLLSEERLDQIQELYQKEKEKEMVAYK